MKKKDLAAKRGVEILYFPSLDALRKAHLDLHQRSVNESGDPKFQSEVEAFLLKGRETGAFLDARSDRNTAQTLVNYWATFLDRCGRAIPDVMLKDFDPMLFPEIKNEDCPYLGLDSFREEQKGFFFGRQSRINEMIAVLNEKRLLAVVGPSGSGKSSIVLAGLVPALKSRTRADGKKWHYYKPFVPGSNPLKNLAEVLLVNRQQHSTKLSKDAPEDLSDLDKVVENLEGDGVIIIDQFEEVFTLCQDDTIRKKFINCLQKILELPGGQHMIILTMRSDFEEYLPRLSEFYNLFETSKYDLRPMSVAELREAIEAPANLVGLKFEEGVVDALIRDLLGEPAGLPLLQFTLLKLWDNRQRNRVTMEAYQRLGGGRQALERTAEEFYKQLLPEDQNRVRYIFLRLVRPGKGLEVTSNRIQRKTLYPTQGERKTIDQVLEKILAVRLIRLSKGDSPEDDQLEIAHEALVRNWDRLVEWVASERGKIRRRMRLTLAAEQWESVKRDRGALLRGVLLEEALQYDDLKSLEIEYVEASKIEVEKEQNRWRALAEQAEQQARVATARQLAAQSQITRYSHRRLLLALEALRTTLQKNEPKVPAAEEALQKALANAVGRGLGKYHDSSVTVILMTPDNHKLITSGADKTIRIWDVSGEDKDSIPGKTSKVLRGHEDAVTAIAVSPNGRWLASGSADKTVRVWDLEDLDSSSVILKNFQYDVRIVAISPNNRWLVVGTEEKVIYRWDVDNLSNPPIEMHGHIWGIRGISFSADSLWMLSGSDDGTARLWNLQSNEVMPLLGGSDDTIWSVSFTADDKWLIACSVKGLIRIWQREHLDISPAIIQTSHGSVTTMAVTPDSQWIVTGGSDSLVKLWKLTEPGTAPIILTNHEDWISVIIVSNDNRWLITGSEDKTVRIWDFNKLFTAQPDPIVMCGHERVVRSASVSNDNRWLATCSNDGTVQLLDLDEPQKASYPQVIHDSRAPIAISRNGQWLATSSKDRTIMLFDLTTAPESRRILNWNGSYIRSIAISPNNHWMVAGSEHPQLLVCDLTHPEQNFFELHGHAWGIRSIAFSSDSRWLASGSDDHTVRLWDFEKLDEPPWVFPGGDTGITVVVMSQDQKWLIAGDWYGTVRIWDLENRSMPPRGLYQHRTHIWALRVSPDNRWLVTTSYKDPTAYVYDLNETTAAPVALSGHGEWVTAIQIDSHSRRLVTVSEDPLIRVWDLADLSTPPVILRGHEWGIRAMDISSDNSLLITGSDDKSIRIWQMNDLSDDPVVFQGHNLPITELAITPDNHWLVTASINDHTRLWKLRLEDMMDRASYLAGRNFFLDEWKQYFPKQSYRKTCPEFRVPRDAIEQELEQAQLFHKKKDGAGATEAYRRATAWAIETDDAELNWKIGRQGCIDNLAEIVLPACEHAVALNPTHAGYRDTRGVARMLTGDLAGAIDDFQFSLPWVTGERSKEILAIRVAWLAELKQGKKPAEESVAATI